VRVLVDECLPKAVLKSLVGHACRTVPQMGWVGIKNGTLLALAEQQFDVFLTVDRNLSYQQDLGRFKIAFVVIRGCGTRIQDLVPVLPKLAGACAGATAGVVTFVDP
jgi:hypothetical protein